LQRTGAVCGTDRHRRSTFTHIDDARDVVRKQENENKNNQADNFEHFPVVVVGMASTVESMLLRHVRARLSHPAYDEFKAFKFAVPDDKASWLVPWPEYRPIEFTHPRILEQPPYADPVDARKTDWSTRHFSLAYKRQGLAAYIVDDLGRPRNPAGRTGMTGRGRLGKWGANVAADALVTRRAADDGVFEFVAIQRSDTGLWALPGGMVDSVDETFEHTAVREFFEEAGTLADLATVGPIMEAEGAITYSGHVDDNRATDNAWTETSVFHWQFDASRHPPLRLKAADDAIGVAWLRTDSDLFNAPDTFHCHHRVLVLHALGLLSSSTDVSQRPKDGGAKPLQQQQQHSS
jgi:ADP-ribose pyrophosphatase